MAVIAVFVVFVLRWPVELVLLLLCPYVDTIIMNIMNSFTLLSSGKFPFYINTVTYAAHDGACPVEKNKQYLKCSIDHGAK